METLSEKLAYACEQVRRLRADGDSTALTYWFYRREELLDQLSVAMKQRVPSGPDFISEVTC